LSALAIIKEAADCGVRVSLNGASLALKAVTKPSDELLAKLREHKAEIVALLRQEAGIARPEPDETALEERKTMSIGSVPEPYLDSWGRMQCQVPIGVSDEDYRVAVDDAGRFLDRWGSLAVESEWTPGDLFDVPRDGSLGGVVWFLNGEAVRALDPEHATTESGRTFIRLPAQSVRATVSSPQPKSAPVEPPKPSWWPKPHPRIVKEPPFGSDGVPARYRAAWDVLLAQCPAEMEPFVWETAMYDAARLFGDFGIELERLAWSPDDLFGMPHGVVWFVKGNYIAAIGSATVELTNGRMWFNRNHR
jgi:hypothetical protein